MRVWVQIQVEVDIIETCDDGSVELEVIDSYEELCSMIIEEAQEIAARKNKEYIDGLNASYMEEYAADRKEYISRF